MKANFNLLIPTTLLLLTLAGCKSNVKTADEVVTPDYNPTDARAFGMLGDVKEVRVTIIKEDADPGEEPVTERDLIIMSFDQKGRVTLDPYGNKYVYDADGNFIEGVSKKSIMERDSLGRIIAYANKLNDNDREQYGMSFKYDEQGRIATMTKGYWEVGYDDTLVYKSDKVYPDRFISDGVVESMVERVYIDYEYKDFDEKGNWTERTCRTLYKCWDAGEQESDADVERWTTTEQRTIRYYSDDPEKPTNEVAEDVDDHFTTDIFGFGLLGRVKEVVTTSFTAYEDGKGALVKQTEIEGSRATITFDAEGRVTEDPFGGIYVYDAEGNFVKGASAMSIMKRDDQQRVVNYQTKQDDEDDAMFRNDYTYDPQGRLVKVNQVFWESTETSTFVYDGDEIYPNKRLFDNFDEGIHVTSETTYRYTQFDDQGNWIQRELRYKGTEAEEDGFNNNDVTHWDGAMIEERTISYY